MQIDVLVLLAVLAIGFAILGIWRPKWAFYAAVAIAPWQELMVDIGLRLTLYTLSMTGLLIAVIWDFREKWRSILNKRIWWPLVALLLWALGRSLVQSSGDYEAQVTGGIMRSPAVRPMVQIASLSLSLLPVLAAPFLLSSCRELVRLGQVFLGSVALLVLLGWWQLYQANVYGYNPLPMGVINVWLEGLGGGARDAMDLGPGYAKIYRMNSLGGEPRYLALSIATALLLIQIGWMSRRLQLEKFGLLLFIYLFVALLATMSMSGLYLWLIGIVAVSAHFFLCADYVSPQRRWILVWAGLLGGLVLLWVGQRTFQWGSPLDALTYLLHRVMRRGVIADFDSVILDFLKTEPSWIWLGVGLGNVHLHAAPYLTPYFRDFAEGTCFVADSGWLRLVSELGLVGLGFFLWWCCQIWATLRELRNDDIWGESARLLTPIFLVAVVGYLARGTSYAPVAFMLFAAAVVPIFSSKLPT